MEDNRQFRRTYELIIGTPGSRKGLTIKGDEEAGTGLQLTFDVKKHIDNKEQSNTATINLFNFSEDSIAYIQPGITALILKVGYNNDNKQLFQGIITEVETDDGSGRTDRKTSLKCVPSDALTYQPFISKTFPANTTPRQVINYLIGQSETLSKASFNSENIDKTFPFGYPTEGTVKSILSELARDFQFQYRIDGRRLYINDPLRYEAKNSPEKAVVISPATGLLGLPSYASSDGKKTKDDTTKKNGVKFKALINPLMRPGGAVSIKGTTISGIYRLNSTRFSGDWRGNKWEVECHCARLTGQEI